MRKKAGVFILILIAIIGLSSCDQVKNRVFELTSTVTEDVAEYQRQLQRSQVLGEITEVESVSDGKYAYSCLNDEEKLAYDQMLDAILNFKSDVSVSTTDLNVLETAYEAIKADYGGIFWFTGYSYVTYYENDGVTIMAIKISPQFTMTKEQKEKKQAEIDAVVDQWLEGSESLTDDYEKTKFVYETLINRVDYNAYSLENQNIISVFLNQSTVCQGYASAASYLLERLGVPSTIITGSANGEPHAWNLVYVNNAYYFMDVTWGNSHYRDKNNEAIKRIGYEYLNVTGEELFKTHTVDEPFALPECVSNADNYYIREELYFTDWYPELIGNTIQADLMSDKKEATLKFASADLMNRAKEYYLDEQHIYDYLSGVDHLSYYMSEEMNTLTILR